MADVYEQNLPQKTDLTTSDYVRVVGSDNNSYKQPLSDVAQKTVENYAGSTLAGSAQSVKSAIDGLNTSINGVASDLASESSTRASQDTNLQTQINQLVAPTGTAPNPAEIENARIGADNVTYTTLGDAIRTQVTDLKSDIDVIKDLFISTTESETIVTADSGATWEAANFYTGDIGSAISKSAYNNLSCAVYGEVHRGEVLTVNARSAGTGYALYLTDSNGIVIDRVLPASGNYYNNQKYTVPKDGVLYLNCYTADYLSGGKAYKLIKSTTTYSPISDVIDEIEDIYSMFNSVDITTRVVTADSGVTWESANFYNGNIGASIQKTSYANLSCAVYGAVNKGERYTVNARKAGTGYAIYLTDDSGIILDYFDTASGVYYNGDTYTVPQDGVMYLNTYTEDYLTDEKVYYLDKTIKEYESEKSILNGIKWTSIGDSIVEFNGTAEQNWVKDMIATTGILNTNLAIGGTGFYRASDSSLNYISRISMIPNNAELITVCGSFNDLSSSPLPELPVGTVNDSGTSTLAGYMNDFFDALIEAFPTTPIAVMMTNPWQSYRPSVTKADEYVSVLKAICEKNGIPFYGDCYYGCNLKPWNAANRAEYFTHPNGTVDGTHPNSKGHLFIYRMMKPFMEKVVNKLV